MLRKERANVTGAQERERKVADRAMTACKFDYPMIQSHASERLNCLCDVIRREYCVIAAPDDKRFLGKTCKLIEVSDGVDHAPALAQLLL